MTEIPPIAKLSAAEMAIAIRNGAFSARDAVDAHLRVIDARNTGLNAIVTLDADSALERAEEADVALSRGDILGPLHGVPFTAKDCFETAGLRTTCGYEPLRDYVPVHDATVVARMKSAGAILLGKTHTPPLNQDFQTRSSLFGVTNNPWNTDYSPGGSGGGGAAAVASHMTPIDLGCDDGGSIRIPASFCGVFGLKPTEHSVSGVGHIPDLPDTPFVSRDLISYGPLARAPKDLALCYDVIAGPDIHDPKVEAAEAASLVEYTLKGARIAWTDSFPGLPIARNIANTVRSLVVRLADEGAIVERRDWDGFDVQGVLELYGEIFGIQSESGMSEEDRQAVDTMVQSGPTSPVLACRWKPRDTVSIAKAYSLRERFFGAFEFWMSDADVFLCPVTAIPPHKHLKGVFPSFEGIDPSPHLASSPLYIEPVYVDGVPVPYLAAMAYQTMVFNLIGAPVVSMPLGATPEGLPFGLQVAGRRQRDRLLMTIVREMTSLSETGAPLGFDRPARGF